MKNFILLLLLLTFSCKNTINHPNHSQYHFDADRGMTCPDFKTAVVDVKVIITEAYEAKYSKVRALVIYKGQTYSIDNGLKGYYHKRYRLYSGYEFKTKLRMYQCDNVIYFDNMTFSEFVIN